MCLAGTFTFFLMRLNLSFALVCMVRELRYVNDTTVVAISNDSFRDDITTRFVSSPGYDSAEQKDSFGDDLRHIFDEVRILRQQYLLLYCYRWRIRLRLFIPYVYLRFLSQIRMRR